MARAAVAILGGTGPQGRGLALRLARAGCPVVIGSRHAAKAQESAAELVAGSVDASKLGGSGLVAGSDLAITGAGNSEAASAGEVVFVSVPWEAHEPTLRSLTAELRGRVVVDLVNPLQFDRLGPVGLPVEEGSAAEQASAILPDSRLVSGFHHVSARILLDETRGLDTDILVCGDDPAAKAQVLALAELIPGVRAVDAGPLRLSRHLEGMTAVLLSVNRAYRTVTGVHLTGLDTTRAPRG